MLCGCCIKRREEREKKPSFSHCTMMDTLSHTHHTFFIRSDSINSFHKNNRAKCEMKLIVGEMKRSQILIEENYMNEGIRIDLN